MNTPVIFIIFNRPDLAERVFLEIRKAQPEKLIVIADGPRSCIAGEAESCRLTRRIIERVDWKCEVTRDFSEVNLGCKKRVSSGISKAFKKVDRAIILEDDCLPNQSFFRFCETILDKYKDSDEIMSISGDNFLFDKQPTIRDSYYFSKYPYIWGWATWKRAWDKYDVSMKSWPKTKGTGIFSDGWAKRFQEAYDGKIDTWDLQWVYACLVNNGLTIVPARNLISNIGFSVKASHTRIKTIVSEMGTSEIRFPLIHPKKIKADDAADKLSQSHFTRPGIIVDSIKNLFRASSG